MSLTGLKKIARRLVPPIGIEAIRWIWPRPHQHINTKPTLEYAPDGWKTQISRGDDQGWNSDSVANTETAKWEEFCRRVVDGTGPLGFSHEHTDLAISRDVAFHNVHITYAYVLALAAHLQTSVSVLDWGGGLGHYYLIGKALLPDVSLDFHCKEVPSMAEAGQRLNPEVHWYADDSCLDRPYDLVMVNGSLQYMEDWKEILRRLAKVTGKYLFLTRLPVVEKGPGFIALQRLYDTEMLHQQFNQEEVLQVVSGLGLRLVREFVVGDRPYIEGAPEPCELRGWLFEHDQV